MLQALMIFLRRLELSLLSSPVVLLLSGGLGSLPSLFLGFPAPGLSPLASLNWCNGFQYLTRVVGVILK